jgi:hypothetical protein
MVMLCQIAWHVEVLTIIGVVHTGSGMPLPLKSFILVRHQTRSMVMLIKFLEPLWKSSWKGISQQDVGVDGWMDGWMDVGICCQ